MNGQKLKNKIVYIGRYNESEILSGPEKTAKRIFDISLQDYDSVFIQYFFDGTKHGAFKKLFGCEKKLFNEGIVIYTSGLLRLFL
ncbi:MAG TPA: hypothetical protein VGK25_10265, partial [Ignavibacteria bacterium]